MNVKRKKINNRGFTLVEVLVAIAVFSIFALGVYEGVRYIFKIVYISKIRILETAVLSEELEIARNLPYESIGTVSGVPSGLLTHSKTINRNGIDFNIITTVRNIDDPFDGMATGTTPIDTAPADYKLIEISAICIGCTQKEPVILNSIAAPETQEDATDNGSLYINVIDSSGAPVENAEVHIYNSSTSPAISIDDVTGSDGWLRIVDIPTSTSGYHIIVTKDGYSTDNTVTSTAEISSPVKPPATVTSRNVTEIYFAIDLVGTLAVHTINPNCSSAGSKTFSIQGEKIIGRYPNVYKYQKSLTTDSGGDYTISDIEWDRYWFTGYGTGWTIGGTVPMLPSEVAAGSNQEISLIVRPYSSVYLLVNVQDASTKLPLADASVRLYKDGFDETVVTGLGYSRQTDWSGGSGQSEYSDETKYYDDSGGIEVESTAGDVKLKFVGSNYVSNGYLESSTFDLGSSVNFQNIIIEPLNQPEEAGADSVRFQLATSNSSTPESWDFIGPDGTSGTYYTSTNTIIYEGHDNERYLRYKLYLSTDDTNFTPILSEIAFTYTNTCNPPGQSYFDGLSASDYSLEVSRSGFVMVTDTISVTTTPIINVLMSAD